MIWWRPIRHVGSVSHAITIAMRDTADVGAWLRGLGLERYEQAFRENEIDAEVLPKLTADDLEKTSASSLSGTGASSSKRLPPWPSLLAAPQAEPSAPAGARTQSEACEKPSGGS